MLRELAKELTEVLEDNENLRDDLTWAEESAAHWKEENRRLREKNAELNAWRQRYEALKAEDLERKITRLEVENAQLRADLQYWRDYRVHD